MTTERWPRSIARMKAHTDPAEAAQRLIELQDEVDRLRAELAKDGAAEPEDADVA